MTPILIFFSCRSLMAEAFLKSFDTDLEVHSAGTAPADSVHPKVVQVMKEAGIEISNNKTQRVDEFLDMDFDYLITVCDHARETCPVFLGKVKEQLHMGFEDPAAATGTEEEVLDVFRKIWDQIKDRFREFYESKLKGN